MMEQDLINRMASEYTDFLVFESIMKAVLIIQNFQALCDETTCNENPRFVCKKIIESKIFKLVLCRDLPRIRVCSKNIFLLKRRTFRKLFVCLP